MTHILIADTDPATRKALRLLIRLKLGVNHITEVMDVESLIRALMDTLPTWLFLDWKLCGSPPLETCHLLQKAFPHLKIVLLSLDANDEVTAKKAGIDFIQKGTEPDAIIGKLTSLFHNDVLSAVNSQSA